MKKLLLLCLVALGGVLNASAWNTMYLNCDDNNWGSNGSLPFKWIDTNSYYYILSPDHITNGNFYFRFHVRWDDNSGGEDVAPLTDGEEITSAVNTNVNRSSTTGSFKLAQNSDAKFVVIYIYWANNTWNLYSQVITETTTVAFVDIDNNWSTAKAYAWLSNDVKLLGDWPGTLMTKAEGIYTLEIPYVSGAKIKFTDKNEGSDVGNESSNFDMEENAIYKYNTKVENVPVTISSVGYATFSSAYPVDFSNSGISAYRATQTSDNKVLLTKVDKAPAATGLVVVAENGAEVDVPTTIWTTSVGENKLVATVKETAVDASNNNYMLANGANGVGFYYVATTGIKSEAGKAYLHTDSPLTNENNTARVAWIFADDNATGINTVRNAQNDDVLYDLQGRVAKTANAGLYIKNGKKVFVK